MDVSVGTGGIVEEGIVDKYLTFTDYSSGTVLSILQVLFNPQNNPMR